MNATSGLTGTNSLSSATLQSSLESRLRAKTDLDGSILYRLTWKQRVTPLGRAICALRASAKRISVNACILSGWPTTTTRDWKDGPASNEAGVEINALLGRAAWLAGWGTPLSEQANGTPEKFLQRKRDSMARGAQSMGVSVSDLQMQAVLAGWNTPTAPVNTNGHQAGNNRFVSSVTEPFKNQTIAIRGKLTNAGWLSIGFSVEILPENQAGGPLNPAHSRWLMGLPIEWENCAPLATGSTRKQRQISAKSSAKSPMIYNL